MFYEGLREKINTDYVEKWYTRGQTLPKKKNYLQLSAPKILYTANIVHQDQTAHTVQSDH